MVATLELLNLVSAWPSKSRSSVRIISTLIIGIIVAAFSASAHASPLSTTSFGILASLCAPGTDISILRAVASVESHFNPFAVRDNTTRESWTPHSIDTAASIAKERLTEGHSVDIGLMQINSANLTALGMTVENAFDACHSLTAANRILLSAFAAGSNETERQAALLIALSRYNTGKPLTGIANGYANQVAAAQSAPLTNTLAPKSAMKTSPQWNIWDTSGAEPESWVVTAEEPSEIKRAGAQTSDARDEGRAPASSSEKGEPYELFAYQESEASQP
jgi:type IV secretion system protein VirB1